MKRLLFLLLTGLLLGCNPGQKNDEKNIENFDSNSNLFQKNLGRVIAIGDLHGDYNATLRVFKLAKLIDAHNQWVAKNTLVVQTGDQLDRGDQELEILKQLEAWQTQAAKLQSQLVVLNGNHEYMNAKGDLRYVTPVGFSSFASEPKLNLSDSRLANVPSEVKPRAAALMPGGPWAMKMAKRPTIFQYVDTVFVHGGVLPQHVTYGIEKINRDFSAFLAGAAPLPEALWGDDSPVWSRHYSNPDTPPDCEALNQTLKSLNAKRMVVAHSVHGQINSACQDKVWRIDVGMSAYYKGQIQALEIGDKGVTILKEK